MKKILFVLVVMGLVFSSAPVLAKDGFYIGGDLGIAMAPGMDVTSSDNDTRTVCDGFINPNPAADCVRTPSSWPNEFDGGTGILAGAALGYRMGSFRVEGEYFYRSATHDSMDPIDDVGGAAVNVEKARQELDLQDGGLDDVLSHNFFANLYYDYRSNSKFTPYVGFGIGFSQVSLDYFNRWRRNADPQYISTFDDVAGLTQDEKDDLNRKVAGTTTIARAKLSDTLFGYQVIAGVDYQVTDPVSIGLKFRWADFGEFESDPREWDQLRSHESALGPGGGRVRYKVMTDDIQFWGVSLNMKYQF